MASKVTSPQQLWRTQFNRQLTDEMMERVVKQTTLLIRKVESRTPWRDTLTPDDRLHTVIMKTLDGTLRWDPARVDLERHFLGAIAGSISHELEHAQKFPRVSLDDEKQNAEKQLEHEASEALRGQRESKEEVPKDVWWTLVIDEFRKHGKGDAGVLAILDAYRNDRRTRREVIEFTGMSSRKYHAAYQRLVRLAQKIDDDVRNLVMQAIA